MTVVGRAGSLVARGNTRVLVLGKPGSDLPGFLQELVEHHVTLLVRACEATYDTKLFTEAGIRVVDLPVDDGGLPSEEQQETLLQVAREALEADPKATIAVHCVAGLGRSCVLAALLLVANENMDPLDCVHLIRTRRKGAFNKKQLHFVASYKPKKQPPRLFGRVFACFMAA